MLETGGIEHEFRGLVARIVGSVPEVNARRFQRPRHAIDGSADGLSGRMG